MIQGCTDKKKYLSSAKAREAMARHRHADDMNIYECRHCKHWHLGRFRRKQEHLEHELEQQFKHVRKRLGIEF